MTGLPRVTVLAGFRTDTVLDFADALLRDNSRLILVHHDISRLPDGIVRRQARTADRVLDDATVTLQHGCVGCTLRQDAMPTLLRLARRHPGHDLLLALPAAVEPEEVAIACRHCTADSIALGDLLHFDSYVTVVDAASFQDDLSTTDDLRDRDLQAARQDGRSVAQVVARQVEFADTVVVHGSAGGAFEDAQLAALLDHLAPWAIQARPGRDKRTGHHDPDTPGMMLRALEGRPIGVHDPDGGTGVASLLFDSRRPFHPQRLYHALPELTGGALRGRGQLWIASQPDTVLGWETAGRGVGMTPLGRWLGALPVERRQETSDLRRLTADALWDPYYEDRRTALSFVGLTTDPGEFRATLDACLLTDAELAGGRECWLQLPDPFEGFFSPTAEGTQPGN